MAIQPGPADNPLTRNNVFIGMPFVEFAPQLAGGGFDAFRSLGIVDAAELQKTLATIQLINAQSGVQRVEREEVTRVELALQVGLFKFDAANLQLFLGSTSVTAVSGGSQTVTNEIFTVRPSDRFGNLENRNVTAITGINPRAVSNEQVGVGDSGTTGETTGDFRLDYPIELIGDVTSFTVGGTERVGDLVAGSAPAAGQIAIVVGAVATSGHITFPAGESPADGAAIVASYTPSFDIGDFLENTDFVLDPLNGGLRFLAGNNKVRAEADDDSANGSGAPRPAQQLDVDYTFDQIARNDLVPFTQNVFLGRARISQLTNLGVNFIWDVPSASVRITDDAFAWNRDEFALGTLILNVLSDPNSPSAPFGTWQHFEGDHP